MNGQGNHKLKKARKVIPPRVLAQTSPFKILFISIRTHPSPNRSLCKTVRLPSSKLFKGINNLFFIMVLFVPELAFFNS